MLLSFLFFFFLIFLGGWEFLDWMVLTDLICWSVGLTVFFSFPDWFDWLSDWFDRLIDWLICSVAWLTGSMIHDTAVCLIVWMRWSRQAFAFDFILFLFLFFYTTTNFVDLGHSHICRWYSWHLIPCIYLIYVFILFFIYVLIMKDFSIFVCCCTNLMFYDRRECVMSVLGTTKHS